MKLQADTVGLKQAHMIYYLLFLPIIAHIYKILNLISKLPEDFDVLLTVHLSITLVNDQLDAQFFYFITRLLQSSTCFEQRRAHHQEVRLY